MQSLDELRRVIRRIETRRPPRPAAPPAHEVLGGELVETGAGPLLIVRREYPLTHIHGRQPLAPAFAAPLDLLSAVARAAARARARGGGRGPPGPGRPLPPPPPRAARAAGGGLHPHPPRRPLARRAPRLVRPRPRVARPPGRRGPRGAGPPLGAGGSRAGTRVLPGRAHRGPRGPRRPPGAPAPGALGEAGRALGRGVRALGDRQVPRRIRSGALGGDREVPRAPPARPPRGARDRRAGARGRQHRRR